MYSTNLAEAVWWSSGEFYFAELQDRLICACIASPLTPLVLTSHQSWHVSHIVLCFSFELLLLFMNNERVWVLCYELLVVLVEGLPATFHVIRCYTLLLYYHYINLTDIVKNKMLASDWSVQMVVDQWNDKWLVYSIVVKTDNFNRSNLTNEKILHVQ